MHHPAERHVERPGERRGERGASAVEYGLLLAGIAAIIVISVFAFGGSVKGLFGNTCSTFISAAKQGSC